MTGRSLIHIRNFSNSPQIMAGDGTLLRELLHPDRTTPLSARYSLAHAIVPVGSKSKPHRLKTSEVYYILDGTGRMHIDDSEAVVRRGDCFEISPSALQWIENIGDTPLEFLCIVDPAWQLSDEQIVE